MFSLPQVQNLRQAWEALGINLLARTAKRSILDLLTQPGAAWTGGLVFAPSSFLTDLIRERHG
jgi:hypothetical protein